MSTQAPPDSILAVPRFHCQATVLLYFSIFVFCSFLNAQDTPVPTVISTKVAEFENSKFFKSHNCHLDSIEPMRYHGIIDCWFYNYLNFRENSKIPTQFGIRIGNDGERVSPYIILRWFPVNKLPDIDFSAVKDYTEEIIEGSSEELLQRIKQFATEQFHNKNGSRDFVPSSQTWQFGRFKFSCDFTRGNAPRYSQFTLIVELQR